MNCNFKGPFYTTAIILGIDMVRRPSKTVGTPISLPKIPDLPTWVQEKIMCMLVILGKIITGCLGKYASYPW